MRGTGVRRVRASWWAPPVVAASILAAPAYGWQPPVPRGAIEHGPRTVPAVALTFDADMTRPMLAALRRHTVATWGDPAVVRELRATHTPATIFVTGLFARLYPRRVRALARDSLFELENHTWDHGAFTSPCYGLAPVGEAHELAEVTRAAGEIGRLSGRAPRYFRFPGGCGDAGDVRLVRSVGEQPVQWDVISGDSFMRRPSSVVREVLTQVRDGSVVVFHLVGPPLTPATAPALQAIIPALRARGFRLVTLAELLRRR